MSWKFVFVVYAYIKPNRIIKEEIKSFEENDHANAIDFLNRCIAYHSTYVEPPDPIIDSFQSKYVQWSVMHNNWLKRHPAGEKFAAEAEGFIIEKIPVEENSETPSIEVIEDHVILAIGDVLAKLHKAEERLKRWITLWDSDDTTYDDMMLYDDSLESIREIEEVMKKYNFQKG